MGWFRLLSIKLSLLYGKKTPPSPHSIGAPSFKAASEIITVVQNCLEKTLFESPNPPDESRIERHNWEIVMA